MYISTTRYFWHIVIIYNVTWFWLRVDLVYKIVSNMSHLWEPALKNPRFWEKKQDGVFVRSPHQITPHSLQQPTTTHSYRCDCYEYACIVFIVFLKRCYDILWWHCYTEWPTFTQPHAHPTLHIDNMHSTWLKII